VAHVLEGSVQRAGNRVRVNVQLVDTRTDAHLWAQTYDRDLADVFAIQSEIAKMIADELQAKLSPSERSAIERPPTSDITAFDLYTRAKNLGLTASFNVSARPNLLQAVDLETRAVAHDPSFSKHIANSPRSGRALFLWLTMPPRLAMAEAAIQAFPSSR
jgi:hypothetical protein